jgi:predicted enzyme related to lactoylglutathione lyase
MDGKICYLEIPAANVDASAAFYADVFGWRIRMRGDGARAFDDATGAVSGAWVARAPAAPEAGVLVYVMVDSITDALGRVATAGGATVTPKTPIGSSGASFAVCRDPAGNRVGLYQEPAAQRN